jgi:hypothetical protein
VSLATDLSEIWRDLDQHDTTVRTLVALRGLGDVDELAACCAVLRQGLEGSDLPPSGELLLGVVLGIELMSRRAAAEAAGG